MATINVNLECDNCTIASGFENPCRMNSAGGIQKLWLIPLCEIDTIVDEYDNDLVTAINLTTGSTGWYEIDTIPDTTTIESPLNTTNGSFNYNINFQVGQIANATDDDEGARLAAKFVNDISNITQRFALVALKNTGVRFIYGEKSGLRPTDGTTYTSGANEDELAGYTVALRGGGSLHRPLDKDLTLTLA